MKKIWRVLWRTVRLVFGAVLVIGGAVTIGLAINPGDQDTLVLATEGRRLSAAIGGSLGGLVRVVLGVWLIRATLRNKSETTQNT